jgi:hypothetical protein
MSTVVGHFMPYLVTSLHIDITTNCPRVVPHCMYYMHCMHALLHNMVAYLGKKNIYWLLDHFMSLHLTASSKSTRLCCTVLYVLHVRHWLLVLASKVLLGRHFMSLHVTSYQHKHHVACRTIKIEIPTLQCIMK